MLRTYLMLNKRKSKKIEENDFAATYEILGGVYTM